MPILSAQQTTVQKRRNLFGLGVTSLIVACSNITDNDTTAVVGIGKIPTVSLTPTAPLTPDELITFPDNNAGITVTAQDSTGIPSGRMSQDSNGEKINNAGIKINLNDAPISHGSVNNPVLAGNDTVTFHINNGNHTRGNDNTAKFASASLYEVTGTGTYDLIVSSPEFGNIAGDELTGGVYIYWDIAEVVNGKRGTIDIPPNHLEVKGLPGDDAIAQDAPEFFKIDGGSASDQYDMVVRSNVDAATGAIYILWDVAAYKTGGSVTIDFAGADDNAINATHGLLKITSETAGGNIGQYSPEFFKLSDTDTADDMVIRSDDTIYILWDVAVRYNSTTVDLYNTSALALLEIVGATGENISKHSPDFWQIGGTDAQHDMVIRSDDAIYVLWDVAAYDNTATTPIKFNKNTGINHGLLKITSATDGDNIGQYSPEFLKINNNDDYDMIIRSDTAKNGAVVTGAMYILWDVAEYYSKTALANISLTDASAGNGLLTLYSKAASTEYSLFSNFASSLSDIDGNGINDLAFTDGGNTFILFGEQLAYRDNKGKAVSDKIDMAKVDAAFTADTDAGFFSYDKVVTPATTADLKGIVGYRFANDDLKTLDTIDDAFDQIVAGISGSLSDADADLGVWDIA